MRRILAICVALSTAIAIHAQQDPEPRFTADLKGGIYINNEEAWLLEPSIAWNFSKYIGIGIGMEITSQYNQPSRLTHIDGQEAALEDSYKNINWILFKPRLVVKTPALLKRSDSSIRMWLQAEPGVSVAAPSHNSLRYEVISYAGNIGVPTRSYKFANKGLDWFYWNVSLSANVALDRVVVSAGYALSNFDYYSCRRNVTLQSGSKFQVPKKELSQRIFLSIGWQF